jgi:hypothetical protein
MRRLPPLLALIAATLLMMAVAFADGRPTVFYDSHSYDVMGRNLIEVVQEYPASIKFKMYKGVTWGDPPVASDRDIDPNTMGARSAYYGAFLHLSWQIGTIWLLAAVQSFLAAWVVYLLWRTLAPKAPLWSYLAVVSACVAGSSVSFFTTFSRSFIATELATDENSNKYSNKATELCTNLYTQSFSIISTDETA